MKVKKQQLDYELDRRFADSCELIADSCVGFCDPSDIKRESKYSGTAKAHAWKPRFINSGGATPEFENYGPGVYKLRWFTD